MFAFSNNNLQQKQKGMFQYYEAYFILFCSNLFIFNCILSEQQHISYILQLIIIIQLKMTLYVKLMGALLTRDTQVFSNMDPYVIAIVGVDKKRSKTHQEGGKKPKWDETFTFKPTSNSMLITVYDEDVVSDDVVGSVNIDLKKYINNPNPIEQQQNFQLTYKGRKSGTIKLSIKYQANNNSIWGNNNSQPQSNSSGWGNEQNPNNNSNWGNQPDPNNSQGWNNVQPANNGSNWGNQNPTPNNNSGWAEQAMLNSLAGSVHATQPMPPMQNGWQNCPPTNNSPINNNQVITNPLEVVNTAFNVSQMTQSMTRPLKFNQDPNIQNSWQQQGSNPNSNNGNWGPNNNGWGNQPNASNNGW